jgi:hypothetical protein
MKKLTILAAALAALASAGIAVAHGIDGAQSVAAVNATFSAAPAAGSSNTRTCTTSAGKTIASTKATYTGTATGSPDLTGPVTIAAQSTIDTTDDIGVVNGTLRVGKTEAHFSAVYDHGAIAGTASGHGATPHVQLLGNVSAGYTTTGGFTSGKLGGGTSGGSAVELTAGGCAPAPSQRESSSAEGAVSAVSSTSITVAGLTCTVPASLAAKVTTVHVGDRVEIRCALGALVKIEAKTKH